MELRRARYPLMILAAAIALDLSAACSSGGGGASAPKPLLSDIQAKIFSPSCALATGCHDANANTVENNLKLTDVATWYAALVGVAAYDTTAGSVGITDRVVAGDPTHSFLVYKLDPANFVNGLSPIHGIGVLMPNGTPGLSKADRHAIALWISNGAQNN